MRLDNEESRPVDGSPVNDAPTPAPKYLKGSQHDDESKRNDSTSIGGIRDESFGVNGKERLGTYDVRTERASEGRLGSYGIRLGSYGGVEDIPFGVRPPLYEGVDLPALSIEKRREWFKEVGRDWDGLTWQLHVLGLPDEARELEKHFPCVLHPENSKHDAILWRGRRSGEIIYRDFKYEVRGANRDKAHRGALKIPELYASIVAGEVRKFREPMNTLVWRCRLLLAADLCDIPQVELPELPSSASVETRRVYDGLRLSFESRWLYAPGEPIPYSPTFAQTWTGCADDLKLDSAIDAIDELLSLGVMHVAERLPVPAHLSEKQRKRWKPMRLFLPGRGES